MITVFGDSHANIFSTINSIANFQIFRVVRVPGATALGAVRPDSKTNSLNEYRKVIDDKTIYISKAIIQLGEVDCGFLSFLLSIKRGGDPVEYLERSAINVITLANEILTKRNDLESNDIIILGLPYSIYVDPQSRQFLHGLRSEVNVTKDQIDEGIDRYNNMLKTQCEMHSFVYIDTGSFFCDKKHNVYQRYLPNSPYDHHLNYKSAWPALICALLGENNNSFEKSHKHRSIRQYSLRKAIKYLPFSYNLINLVKKFTKGCKNI